MKSSLRLPLLGPMVLVLAACGQAKDEPEPRADWVIRSRIAFLAEDLRTEVPALPGEIFRLWFPYVSGDLHGSPTTGDIHEPTVRPDLTVEIDLNRSHDGLLKSLEKTQFSVSWLQIAPAEARIARLSPLVMEADGIEQVATADFIDADSRQRLMLLYIDRPARITGSNAAATVRYDVQALEAGYVWVAQPARGEAQAVFRSVDRPQNVLLAVTPLAKDPS
jgi:hypothetical protein